MKTEVKSVKELFEQYAKTGFDIPYYQRGYRWTNREIEALLDDINESDKDNGYCLQPIVLQENEGKVSIVDGQQRLTTLSLIWKELDSASDNLIITSLTDVGDSAINKRNSIDKYYLEQAWEAIRSGPFTQGKSSFSDKLNASFFIVCTLDADEDGERVFERLNVGRIPLSSAEILRAYYLTEPDVLDSSDVNRFVESWARMEAMLQDDDFFYFFSHDDTDKCERYFSTRMDFLLEVEAVGKGFVDAKSLKSEYEKDPIFVFRSLKDRDAVDLLTALETLMRSMKQVYEDVTLYNFYGFISCCPYHEGPVPLCSKLFKGLDSLQSLASNVVNGIGDIEKLVYGKNNREIKTILLFHNAVKSNEHCVRFDYNRYRKTDFDLEHIHARAEIKDVDTLKKFCAVLKKRHGNDGRNEVSEFLNDFESFCDEFEDKSPQVKYNQLEEWEAFIWAFESGAKIYPPTEDESSLGNGIGWTYEMPSGSNVDDSADSWRFTSIKNLCLLPASVNRSISNSPFQVKKRMVTSAFLKGDMIPEVSAIVFAIPTAGQESYAEADAPVWTLEMADEYLEDIKNAIEEK